MTAKKTFIFHIKGPDSAQDFAVPLGVTLIGREAGLGLPLPFPLVSRKHAQLDCSEERCTVMDLGSANGTLLNNSPLAPNIPQPLAQGDSPPRAGYWPTSAWKPGTPFVDAHVLALPPDLPPAVLTVMSGVNKVLFYREKLNVIKFEANPGNLSADVSGYELYRKLTSQEDTALTRIATLTPTTLTYSDGKLPLTGYYSYAVKTKFTDGKLSPFSKVVADK